MATKRKQREKRERVSARRRAESHVAGFQGTSVKLPEGVSFLGVKKAGAKRFDIIPYRVPDGAGNPECEDGQLHFERTYWVHRGIGLEGKDSYVCLAKTAGKRCPICEKRARLAADPDTEEALLKALLPKERQLWNIYDPDEPDEGVQVWDVSFHLFGKQLDAVVKHSDENDEEENHYEYFSDPEDGSTLKTTFSEETFAGHKYYEAGQIEFRRRKEPLPDEVVEAANILDDLLIILPYEKLKAIFLQIDDPDDEDDEDDEPAPPPKKSAKKKSPAKPEEKAAATAEQFGIEKGNEVTQDGEVFTVVKISPDGTSLTLMDQSDEVHRGVAPDEVTLIPFEPESEDGPEPKKSPEKKTLPKEKEKEAEPEQGDGDDGPFGDDDDDSFWED